MDEGPEGPILDALAAARHAGLTANTLAKMRLSGSGPVFLKLCRRVLYRRADLNAWLNSRIARDTSDADARLSKSLTGPQRNGRSSIQSRIVTVLRDHSLDDIARLLGVHKNKFDVGSRKGWSRSIIEARWRSRKFGS
jgi:hypothetical protein